MFKKGASIEASLKSGYIPCGPAYTGGAKFLQLEEETVEFYERKGQKFEVRWLGFGYFLVTPVGMAEQCGTEEEIEPPPTFSKEYAPGKFRNESGCYPLEKWIEAPFIVYNTEEQIYNPYAKGIMEVV